MKAQVTIGAKYTHSGTGWEVANAPYVIWEDLAQDNMTNKSWSEANAACTAKGAGWRLPTIAELKMANWLPDIRAGFKMKNSYYWSATDGSKAFAESFYRKEWSGTLDSMSGTFIRNKTLTISSNYRCVRRISLGRPESYEESEVKRQLIMQFDQAEAMAFVDDCARCTSEYAYYQLKIKYKAAMDVFVKDNVTQEELEKAYTELREAVNNLILNP